MIAPNEEPAEQERARAYEAEHHRLLLIQMGMTVLAVAAYHFSGASQRLADGVIARFGDRWLLSVAAYLLVTFFGFAVYLFPLGLYSDFQLERKYGLSERTLENWLWEFAKSSVLEILLGVAFFTAIYGLLGAFPHTWWIGATVVYVLFSVVLSALAPLVIIPLFHDLRPLEDAELDAALVDFMKRAGAPVTGVYRWGLGETTNTANAALAGWGRSRRIILADTLLDRYSREEIIAILAHEVGHLRNRDLPRLLAASTLVSGAGFYVAHLVMTRLVGHFGFAGVADVAAFPWLVFSLFVFSIITMPLVNAYSRRREFAADAFAVQSLRTAQPLVSALEKLAGQNLADRDPNRWIEFLLHSHPSIGRRVARARTLESQYK